MFNPIKTIKTNTLGTLNILGLARRTRAKVLLASTSEVYGDPEVHPQNEEYWGHVNPIGPRFAYCTESVKSLIPRLVIVTSHAAAAVLRRNLSETVSPKRWFWTFGRPCIWTIFLHVKKRLQALFKYCYPVWNCRACYDEGKRVAETLMYSYASQEGIDVRVARIFNTYGTRMNLEDGRVISNFITQALKGDPITVCSNLCIT